MKTIDARGQLCPTPLIMTKRAIAAASVGEVIEVLSDNDTAKCNLLDYIGELGYQANCVTDNTEHIITFTINSTGTVINNGNSKPPTNMDPVLFCSTSTNKSNDFTIVLKSEYMGDGEKELGVLLMRSCINSLSELDLLPTTIILYNSGVMLALEGSDTGKSLHKLNSLGVEIIVCGTCVDYYGCKDRLAVGTISNMYKINSILSQTGHVVYP